MPKSYVKVFCYLFSGLFLASISVAQACTGIKLQAKDGSVVYGRTLEFGKELDSVLLIVPRNYHYFGMTPEHQNGLSWTTHYAFVGTNGSGLPDAIDGVNEKGLAVGLFYFPGYAGYQPVTAADAAVTLAPWQLGSWILGNFSSVAEVKQHINEVKVADAVLPAWGITPPLHYIVADKAGNSIVLEYVNGQLNVYDDPVGVLTNAPDFAWHLTNLRNYIHLSAENVNGIDVDNLKLTPTGQGSGMMGLPGDFTPPSRFIRAFVLSRYAMQNADAISTVGQVFHILNQFDIPKGAIQQSNNGHITYNYTQWTSAADLAHSIYYIHTENNRRVRYIDLNKQDLNAKQITYIPLDQPEDMQELTPAH